MERILGRVREITGVDFRHYRPAMLLRRVHNRMLSAGITDLSDYLERLLNDVEEAWHLLERLTIKVSRFLRGRAVFEHLLAELGQTEWAQTPLQIWSAGCAHGEEAYSLAWLLARTGRPGSVLATDVDPTALERAAAGWFDSSSSSELTPADLDQILEPEVPGSNRRRVHSSLRERVSFRRHDLLAPPCPSIGRFDLVCCRNVLIYLHPTAQQAVLERLSDALNPGGLLCLGEAEWLSPPLIEQFGPASRALKLFRRNHRPRIA